MSRAHHTLHVVKLMLLLGLLVGQLAAAQLDRVYSCAQQTASSRRPYPAPSKKSSTGVLSPQISYEYP
jgi:hypothetical protein